jgi:DNA-binding FrmR family transcriptional regulator
MDRLSGVQVVKERLSDLTGQLADMRRMIIEQQKDVAELKGQIRALVQIQSQTTKK